MRLIDIDAFWNYVRSHKINFGKYQHDLLNKQPTVQAIPIEVLQKIWQEIEQELQDYSQYAKDGEDYYLGICTGCDDAIAIIDKHIKEIEE